MDDFSNKKVSQAVIRRLPRYYRYLTELDAAGVTKISSGELSLRMNVTASQIRQDFNCFGGFGQQGYGYSVQQLQLEIGRLLGISMGYSAVIIGTGNLGRALTGSNVFIKRGITLKALFDISPAVIGTQVGIHTVRDIATAGEYCRAEKIDIAVLTLPKDATAAAAKMMSAAGVRGFWNFSNMELKMKDESACVENIHMGDSLMSLCYAMADRQGGRKSGE